MTKKYISIAETNKMIRATLKESFPGVKFCVKKGSGSSSATYIGWTDGPAQAAVEKVVSVYEGAYFDGMIDYKGYKYAEIDGEEVHFAIDFIFYKKAYSEAVKLEVAAEILFEYAGNDPEYKTAEALIEAVYAGEAYYKGPMEGANPAAWSWSSLVKKGLAAKDSYGEPEASKTAASVKFKGDDGYGAGTVGPNGNGPGYEGYPAN